MKVYQGRVTAQGFRVAIVGSCFHESIADVLVQGAQETFLGLGGSPDALTIVRVPGAFEIPCALKKMLVSEHSYDAIVACGVLIKGETTHYEHIADQVAARISELSVEYSLPITFSVITAPSVELAWKRAGRHSKTHLGIEGMHIALEMAQLFTQM